MTAKRRKGKRRSGSEVAVEVSEEVEEEEKEEKMEKAPWILRS